MWRNLSNSFSHSYVEKRKHLCRCERRRRSVDIMLQQIWTCLCFCLIPLTTRAGDVTVSCVWSNVCVLPCTSKYHDIIHWYKVGNSNSVHTFYNEADQLGLQEEQFKGRTSLFGDQIQRGNISLLLKATRTADEGTYKCYTATSSDNTEQFIRLRVRAPVKTVDLKTLGEEISCSTRNVYPKPQIFWLRDGKVEKISVEPVEDKDGLFSVSSVSQTVKENITYNFSISLGDETQSYTASLRREKVVVLSGQDVSIRCPVSQEPTGTANITLMFGNSAIVLSSSQTSQHLTETEWMGKKLHVAPNGTVTIQNCKDTGPYRCVRITAESRQEILTEVQMKSDNQHVSVAVSVAVALCVVAFVAWVCWKCRRRCSRSRTKPKTESSRNNTNLSNDPKPKSEGLLTEETPDQRSCDVEDT